MQVGRFLTRALVGGLFIGHGTQKLFGWFGGSGLDGTEQMMEQLELRPARRNAVIAGATEAVGGALLVAGLATPVAAAGLIGVMVTAVRKVHLPNGVWNANGGYEFNLVMIATLASIAERGPGKLSLDALCRMERHGKRYGLGAIAAGIAASTAAIEMGRRG